MYNINKTRVILSILGSIKVLVAIECISSNIIFTPLKEAINTIGKEHFTSLYSPTRERAFTPKNIKAGFAACSLFLFNPDKVLRSIPALPTEPAVPRADKVKAFISLQNLIIYRDTYALNKTTKVRRSTKSLVLGKAKVISYKDLEEARAKRIVKEAARAAKGKGKRSRKSKSSPPEPEEEEDTVKTARRRRKRISAELKAPEPTNKIARICNAPKPASAFIIQATRSQINKDKITPEL
ncbi:hypothetical protein BKA64DRAFT_694122 [Cadophora sp. MPI-SDFR-AT-0126]|nr:hypothetical protein BKA64DRAFT_694122 [Leotiomycetes sp. MPI-SDFR-AT-0126]